MIAPTVFRHQILLVLAVVAAVAIGLAISFATRDNVREMNLDAAGPGVQSVSALGHRAFAVYLSNLGLAPVASSGNSRGKAGAGGVLIVAEPRNDARTLLLLRGLVTSGATLLVLPKYRGKPDPERRAWVAGAALLPPTVAQQVVRVLDRHATVVRPARFHGWSINQLRMIPSSSALQLVQSARLTPLIATKEGMLVGETRTPEAHVVVVADPEIITNRGLSRGDNARIAADLVQRLLQSGGKVVFDEVVHGAAAPPMHPAMLLFTFPQSLFALQLGIGVVLLAWSGYQRFGKALAAPPAFSVGREASLRAGVQLLARQAHLAILADRYVEQTMRDIAARWHVPPDIRGAALAARLDAVGAARGMRAFPKLPGHGGHADLHGLVAQLRQVYEWKREILHGHRGNKGNHRTYPDRNT